MKTPRQILLARHPAVEPKLDRIRRAAVQVAADVNRRSPAHHEFTFTATVSCALASLYRELIWPCRKIWAGLAAVWLVLLSVNFALREPLPAIGARRASPESSQLEAMFQLREQMLAQLIGPIQKLELVRPRLAVPQPRSQRREEFMNA
jgi:hypothetical protein